MSPPDSSDSISRRNLSNKSSEQSLSSKPVFEWVRGELLGKGSYGRVYLALNATTGEIMAVKQVELPQTASERIDTRQKEVIDALKFESDTLKDLDHPHIVQYLGFEQSSEFMSIFLEYVPGGSVGTCLANHGPFSEDVTRSFTSQILSGLEYLHSKGIIHRDLKADNILVERQGTCKISDFGISKKAEEASTGMKGTIFWMAPEVVGPGTTGYTAKVDIWSMGCVILEMWSGVRPWHGEETVPVMLKLFRDKRAPPVPSSVHLSEQAQDLRRRCFAIDPKARSSAAELRKHPYLVQTPGWVFDPSEIEGDKRSVWRFPSTTKLSDRGSSRGLPPVPQGKTLDAYNSSATVRPYQPTSTTILPSTISFSTPQMSNGTDHSTYRPPANNAPPPPLVYITPPSSPVKQSPDRYSVSNTSPPASESTRTSTTRKKSVFYIVNPDPEEDDIPSHLKRLRMEPYVYNPPPLPNTYRGPPPRLSTSQSMSQLSSPLQTQHIRSYSQSSSPSSSSTYVSSIHSSPLPPTSRTARSDDSDSDGGASDGGTWQKPPVDIHNLVERAPSPRQSRRISIMDRRRESAWARPVIEDVYQHMDEFFPDHDIDKPIIGAGPAETSRAKRKTIRMVAEERLQGERATRMRRRGTKLWGSHTHEVKAP